MLPPPLTPRGHVLVVDDDPGVRDVCTALFHALGYGVAEASCGRTAMARVAAEAARVRLVLLDLEMPGMRGDAVLSALKAAHPHLRIVLMSGRPGGELFGYLARGADGVLRKPFGLSDLGQSVDALGL